MNGSIMAVLAGLLALLLACLTFLTWKNPDSLTPALYLTVGKTGCYFLLLVVLLTGEWGDGPAALLRMALIPVCGLELIANFLRFTADRRKLAGAGSTQGKQVDL
ncbi:MAG: hypothetical protein P4N59_07255 [Negativicutes bacterium]|nr:hypothetical protein [Negativicutes bacterium]